MLYLLDYKKYINKSPSQLWEEDRKAFYWWIISFIVCLFVIFALYLSMLIIFGIDQDRIISLSIEVSKHKDKTLTYDDARRAYVFQLVQECIKSTFILTAFIFLITSFIKGIKNKTFATISFWPTMLMFVLSIYSFIGLIMLPIANYGDIESIKDSWNWSNAYIISFVLNFVYLAVYFFVSRNVALIRNIFTRSQIVEATKVFTNNINNPNFNNGFAQTNNPQQTTSNDNNALYQRLNALDKNQLGKIAKELSISGYETMTKEELLKIIYAIYRSMASENSEHEIETSNEIETKKEDESDKNLDSI